MPNCTFRTRIEAPASAVFDWHKQPGAFERLLPPWEQVEIVERTGGIRDGDRVTLRSRVGPAWTRWIVEHRDYVEGEQFRDVQVSGPFRRWEHTHRVLPEGPNACILEDDILYEVPLGTVGRLFGAGFVDAKLKRMFAYRHAITRADVTAHFASQEREKMRVLVTGSGGLIGSNLTTLLTTGGHEILRLSRGKAGLDASTGVWDTDSGRIDLRLDEPLDVVVHLAGESIAGRWSSSRKARIRDSRVEGTRQVVEWVKGLAQPPKAFLCASAIGFYGNRGEESLTESSVKGEGFLASVCDDWESAALQAQSDQTRVACMRFGVVLSPAGGALAKMLTPFKLGGGGVIGSGRQYWSWISIDDAAGALLHAIHHDDLDGPINVVSPRPVTNREFTKTLGKVLRRPTIVPMPAFAARAALGEMANELLLSSQRVVPERLQQTAYAFRHEELDAAFAHLLGLQK